MKEKVFLAKIAVKQKAEDVKERFVSRVVKNNNGDFVETLIKILISVVIGALVLGLLYALIQAIFPEVQTRIIELFNFDGTGGGGAGAGGGGGDVAGG